MSMYENNALFFFLICVVSLVKSVENAECSTNFLNGTETQQIELNSGCTIFIYESITVSDKSISRIVLKNSPLKENFNGTSATVTIEEYREKEKNYVLINNSWIMNSNETFKRSHFSENLKMRITFSTSEIWSNSNVTLCYEEITFEQFVNHSSYVEGNVISPWVKFDDDWNYRPNSKYTFYIDKNISQSTSNIRITLNELDADIAMGEYLLIGAGLHPLEGPPWLSITKADEKKKYEVYDESAYIVFVTKATSRNFRGFNISWDYGDTTIEKPEIDEKKDVKESAPICIYNITAANEEFANNTPGDYFKDFRENFAKVATDVSENSDDVISASSVSVFRISGVFKDDKSNEALYAMVKITKDSTQGEAAFKRKKLEEIITIYSKKVLEKEIVDKFEFRKCEAPYVPESWFYFGVILIIPVVCFALILWIWKQNPIAEHYEKKRKLKRASFTRRSQHEETLNPRFYDVDNCDFAVQSATENHYITVPKVQLTNEQGRRMTLNLSDTLLCGDNASDDELFNKMFTHKRRSDILELQRMQRTNRLFLTNEGEDNAAFEMDQERNAETERRQHDDRTDHTYESLRSSASLYENTRL
ncbi:uncharacterized protein [Parasteatoda tepidariorum]|uniref:uncharacterized protein n=1 Tax=Parasteatoda tepidariorum TaxID=114398 RepID=UPI00077FC6E5|nr:uncharacterized protein LOC107451568 [Parasteatoda tepidariorum]